jgi:3'-phosphoadenosine 5'-phosphosulfate sulfotransferase (PAPS reductase)/FAD synthetase
VPVKEREVINPYLLDTPAVVSFSGGRTSGYMLYHIIEAFGGTLPDDVKVIFCNTGREMPATLDFVERCSQQWGVHITWLEYRGVERDRLPGKARNGRREAQLEHSFAVVDYATASRNGEPFEQVIEAKYGALPNFSNRYCTAEMKERTKARFMRSIGVDHFTNAIGFRGDEPKRVARSRRNAPSYEDVCFPLFSAGVTRSDVLKWWTRQSFDLELAGEWEGNCDGCFLKSAGKVLRMHQDHPERMAWWAKQESTAASRPELSDAKFFRIDRPPYATLLQLSRRPGLFDSFDPDDIDELSSSCHCTG